jgi:hypothetical protein
MINNSNNISDSSISDNNLFINETYKKKYEKYKIKYIKLLEIYGGKKGNSSGRGKGKGKSKKGDDDETSESKYYDGSLESKYNLSKFDNPNYLEKYDEPNRARARAYFTDADQIEEEKRVEVQRYQRCKSTGLGCDYVSHGGKKGSSGSSIGKGKSKSKKRGSDGDDDDDYYVDDYRNKYTEITPINESLDKNNIFSKQEILILPGVIITSLCIISSIISNFR